MDEKIEISLIITINKLLIPETISTANMELAQCIGLRIGLCDEPYMVDDMIRYIV